LKFDVKDEIVEMDSNRI